MDISKSKPISTTKYLSALLSLMYIARLTRPDILLSVSFLSTKSQHPTEAGWDQIIRILRYLNNTVNYGVVINCKDLTINAYADASYTSHIDGKSHTGYILKIGDAYLSSKSVKQRVGTLSSTDAELVAAVDCLKTVIWIKELIDEIKYLKINKIVLHQANKSLIILLSENTKFKWRYF